MSDYKQSNLVMTSGIYEWMQNVPERVAFLRECITKHYSGDWGNVCADDKKLNDERLQESGMLLSSYTFEDTEVWIITDPGHEVTTILFPSEY